MQKGGSVVMIVVTILLLLGVVGGFVYATNGLTTDMRLFDVKYNGENIDKQVISLSNSNKSIDFSIVPKLGSKSPGSFQVLALPNESAANLAYKVNDEQFTFSGCKDVTRLFDIKVNDNIVSVSSDWNLIRFLADYNAVAESEITLVNYVPGTFSFIDLYFISGKLTIKCSLLEYVEITKINLDHDSIIIGG